MPAGAFYADERDILAATQTTEGGLWWMVLAYAGDPLQGGQ